MKQARVCIPLEEGADGWPALLCRTVQEIAPPCDSRKFVANGDLRTVNEQALQFSAQLSATCRPAISHAPCLVPAAKTNPAMRRRIDGRRHRYQASCHLFLCSPILLMKGLPSLSRKDKVISSWRGR
ncbi:MAG TPA: hypothetical protein VF779_06685 [Pyrinomonadaceae bacterium]